MVVLGQIKKAIDIIMEKGSDVEKAKLNIILDRDSEANQQILLDFFTLHQNNDGGFPFRGERGKLSTINKTVQSLQVMINYGLVENKICQNAIEFLFNRQNPEGYWNEDLAIKEYNPPNWSDPTNPKSRLWITANACFTIAKLDYIPSQYLTKGINFLLKNRDKNGKIKGFFLSNWIAVGIFGILQGPKDKLTQKFASIVESNLIKILGTSDVTWCLQCFVDGGFKKENPIIKRLIDDLLNNQLDDGYWKSIDGYKFDISTTIDTIYVLNELNLTNL